MIYMPQLAQIILYDLEGRKILSKSINGGTNAIEVDHLSEGTYIYEIVELEKVISGGKVVVAK